jgi:fatty acid desaturase
MAPDCEFSISEEAAADFCAGLEAIRGEVVEGPQDLRHLQKIERWGRIATLLGVATCFLAPNPLSALLLALGRTTRWLVMHHVSHGGYDRVPNVPPRYTSAVFARGLRRFIDWLEWIHPDAWDYEHNFLHHRFVNQNCDPDLVEEQAQTALTQFPLPFRYVWMALFGVTWRASYYARNTLIALLRKRGARGYLRRLWLECYLPFILVHFVALPLLFLPLGRQAALSALANSLLGEVLANLHTFAVVGPNHAGEDLYRFEGRAGSKAEYYVRQVVGSVNYRTGGDGLDYAHLWLNYQIEHHLWPDLPMLAYRRVQPKVAALCRAHGIPYGQESVFVRLRKLMAIAVGTRRMRRRSFMIAAPRSRPRSAPDVQFQNRATSRHHCAT